MSRRLSVVLFVIVAVGTAATAEAHSRSHVFLGFHFGPWLYGPPAYAYPPPVVYYPPPVYAYPAPAIVTTPECRVIEGRGETTGNIYRGTACRQPDGTWRVFPH